MVHEKRGTWWAINPKKGKKGFATEAEAKSWDLDKKLPEPVEEPVEEPEDEPDAG